jgi:hypothetical protein
MKPCRPAVPRTGRGDRGCSGTWSVIAHSYNQGALPVCPDHVFTGHITDIYSPVDMNALLQIQLEARFRAPNQGLYGCKRMQITLPAWPQAVNM